MKRGKESLQIHALRVEQWLDEWDKVPFSPKEYRRRPDRHFYLFTLGAGELKALSGIYRRTTTGRMRQSVDLGIQRRHDKERSEEIGRFVRFGFPWSEMSEAKRKSGEFDDLRKLGWLPTAIVVNIKKRGDKRSGQEVAPEELIHIDDSGEGIARIWLPKGFTGRNWEPAQSPPIEVIDGQHRLWAFEKETVDQQYQLPVVAFCGLDVSWQAYLFWMINIKPKRINPSLAFDLYPLLRTEDWLEKFHGHSIYRETRAQELTEALWSHPESPWYQRINMLGERGQKNMVTQAAWIRALMATYVKQSEKRLRRPGGLFGAPSGSHHEVLPWGRAQQAAFLILTGKRIEEAIRKCNEKWAKALRNEAGGAGEDPAFFGPNTLLSTDQGIRGILFTTNDLCYVRAHQLRLEDWRFVSEAGAADQSAVTESLKSLKKQKVADFLGEIAVGLAKYDWRTSSTSGLTQEEARLKAAFRGSGGYKLLRLDLLTHLKNQKGTSGSAAEEVLKALAD